MICQQELWMVEKAGAGDCYFLLESLQHYLFSKLPCFPQSKMYPTIRRNMFLYISEGENAANPL